MAYRGGYGGGAGGGYGGQGGYDQSYGKIMFLLSSATGFQENQKS